MNKKNTIDKATEKKRNTCNFNKFCVFFIHIYLVFLMYIYIYIYIYTYIYMYPFTYMHKFIYILYMY